MYEQTCYTKARAKAAELMPFTCRIDVYSFYVDASDPTNDPYKVMLAYGGKLEGATCTCKGATQVTCYHRAAAESSFKAWLKTEQGEQWFVEKYVCYECGLLPRLENSEVCKSCAGEPKQAHIDQIAQDEFDLFGPPSAVNFWDKVVDNAARRWS